MKRQISYENFCGKGKQEKAINDIREYFNNDKVFDSVVRQIKSIKPSKETTDGLVFLFEIFSGVYGYPVVALLADTWQISEETIYEWLEEENAVN